jgi:phage gpG-like protein
MLSIALVGEDALKTRLDSLPANIVAAIAAKSAALAEALADKVKNEKLSGAVLKPNTGALRDSIVAEVGVIDESVVATVSSAGDIKYAAIHEFGGKTAAHEILPVKAKALAFMLGGATVFAKRVMHPGSNIPERSYLRSSLAEMMDEIVGEIAETPAEIWETP